MQAPNLEILDQYVRARRKAPYNLAPALGREIGYDRSFATIARMEIGGRKLAFPLRSCPGGRCPFCGYTGSEEYLHRSRRPRQPQKWEKSYLAIRAAAIRRIKQDPGIHQVRLCAQLSDEFALSHVQSAVYRAARDGYIVRTKKGNTYALSLPRI